jgi:putative Holliday junction resolvase
LVRQDERFTSKMARRALLEGGASKKIRQKKEVIDKISATLILQGYLEQHKSI